MSENSTRVVLELRAAKDSLTTYENFVHFLASLKSSLKTSLWKQFFGGLDTVTLELACLDQTVYFIITCPPHLEPIVRAQITAQYPDSLVTHMQDYIEPWLTHNFQSVAQMRLAGPNYLPLNIMKAVSPDPMSAILGVLSKVPPQQAAIVQMVLSGAPNGWANKGRGVLIKGINPDPEKKEQHPQKALIEQKLAMPAFNVDIRLSTVSKDQITADSLLNQLAASFGIYGLAEANSLKPKMMKGGSKRKLLKAMITRSADFTPSFNQLNLLEIASLYHLPTKELIGLKNIAWGKTLKGEPPASLPIAEGLSDEEKSKINFFARTEYKNRLTIFGIQNGEDRRRHMYILGKSGTGKTTLIANMAIADIKNGAGVVVIDPHGDLSEILLDHIPADRINDIAYLDPSTRGTSFRINPLYVKNPEHKELVVAGIMSIFKKIWADLWSARMEYILRNTLLTLVNKPDTTFLDIPRLLTDSKFRNKCLELTTDRTLLEFWRGEYDAYSEKFRAEAIAAILNKVGQFVTSPTIKAIIGHPESTIDLEDMINQGKIVILNAAQGRIGEDNAALLGAMIITQIQAAAMNRVNIPESERRDVYLYVDEFQNFATTSFIKILSEARKFHLNLILANQYTAQLPEDLQKAIFGNAGTIISFVVGADDAARLMKELGNSYTQDDLVGLAKHQVISKLTVKGTTSMPFPAYTLPIPFEKNHNREKVVKASRERYYKEIVPEPTPIPVSMPDAVYSSSPQKAFPKPVRATADPTPEDLSKDRAKGLRPTVVGVFVNNKKVLFLYRKMHNIWEFLQGGVDGKDLVHEALTRDTVKTFGEEFLNQCDPNIDHFYKDIIEFPPDKQGEKPMKDDTGKDVKMIGKSYYFYLVNTNTTELKMKSSEFDAYNWLTYEQAMALQKETGKGGKLRITTAAMNLLKEEGLID